MLISALVLDIVTLVIIAIAVDSVIVMIIAIALDGITVIIATIKIDIITVISSALEDCCVIGMVCVITLNSATVRLFSKYWIMTQLKLFFL